MRIDHVSYAAEPDGAAATAERLAKALGVSAYDGGVHPRFGTRNHVLPLAEGRYLEVVEVLDHPASDKAPFGQAVRARSARGGGWMGWVVTVDDLAPAEERLGRQAVPGSRLLPDGTLLSWRQIGIKGLIADPQLPFYLRWDDDTRRSHPSTVGSSTVALSGLTIAGDIDRVRDWLGLTPPRDEWEADIDFEFVPSEEDPGIRSITFTTTTGTVTL